MGPTKQNRRRRQAGQRLCICCSTPFTSHVRLKARQRTCSAECRKKRRAIKMRAWRKNHPGYNKPRKYPPGFWKQYRASHPEGAARNREQARLRAKLRRKSLQRNLDILQAVEIPEKSAAFSGFATTHRCSILRAFGREESS